MKKNQKSFSPVKQIFILAVIGVIGLFVWYIINTKNQTNSSTDNAAQAQQIQNNSVNNYKILGTEDYICTKSVPAQCHGNIKVKSSDEIQKSVRVDKDTDFNGTNPSKLYESDKNPLKAELELDGNRVQNIKLL